MASGDFEAVYAFVRTIPIGKVMSYGMVADHVGARPRTVGFAMGNCPDGVPWHRVVGADGYLRIARRSPALFAEQKARLHAEGVPVSDSGFVAMTYFAEE